MSAGIAALIAHVAFWTLLAYGLLWREIGVRWLMTCVVLWGLARFGLTALPYGAGLYPACLAVLDVALVLKIFKGDVKIM